MFSCSESPGRAGEGALGQKSNQTRQSCHWAKEIANKRGDASFELVDIVDYKLPFIGEPGSEEQVRKWAEKLASLDGFVFVTPEYNHSITGALKNALDSAREEWNNKAAGIISYQYLPILRITVHLSLLNYISIILILCWIK
jgi:NAD(P)H-dependent FMN reductase